jgi:hypothetical protein
MLRHAGWQNVARDAPAGFMSYAPGVRREVAESHNAHHKATLFLFPLVVLE